QRFSVSCLHLHYMLSIYIYLVLTLHNRLTWLTLLLETFNSLISISTPDGKSNIVNASTVFGFGFKISTKRLCVRISNCSRESLYICGERITVNTSRSVGKGTGPAIVAPVLSAVSTIFCAD